MVVMPLGLLLLALSGGMAMTFGASPLASARTVAPSLAMLADATPTRREALLALTAAASAWPHVLPAASAAPVLPVLVLGASGGTGLECVQYLVAQGRPCIAATRSGEFTPEVRRSPLVTVAKGDVTSRSSLAELITPGKLGGVIYAASASRQQEAKSTSDARAVDRDGVIACADLCLAAKVPRLVLVSSGGVSKPKSAVYLILNTVANGIMKAKIDGEDGVRRLYSQEGVADKGLGYTIVRPGGLTREAALGPAAVELNQGDEKSGRISRADVAAICVESLSSEAAFDTTFECYYASSAKGLNDVGPSNALAVGAGVRTDATSYQTGLERRADTWQQLFEGLKRDSPALN